MKVDLPRQPMMGRGRLEPGVAFLMELLLLATLLLATATAQRRDSEFKEFDVCWYVSPGLEHFEGQI